MNASTIKQAPSDPVLREPSTVSYEYYVYYDLRSYEYYVHYDLRSPVSLQGCIELLARHLPKANLSPNLARMARA